MSRTLKTAILSAAALALATAANAGDYSHSYSASSYGPSYNASSYNQSSYGPSSYGGVMSQYEASARYGSGSISESYTDGNVEMYGFSGTLPGLGHNESLQATNCPTAVYNPEGGRVLGCYNVVKPVPKTTYYRIVRPVIYVRYPVCCAPIAPPPPPPRPCCIAPPPPPPAPKPCCVAPPPPPPCYSGCAPVHVGASRYGSAW